MSMTSLGFSPLVPLWLLAALGVAGLAACGLFVWRTGATALLRLLAFSLVLLALANPTLVREEREPVKSIALVLIDRSTSQMLGDRREQSDLIRTGLEQRLGALSDLDTRFIDVPDAVGDDGTRLFTALSSALSTVPPERVAGVVMITDGVVHDIPTDAASLGLKAPLHALITGRTTEIDRRVQLLDAPRFGIVGRDQTIRAQVLERGGPGIARITLRRDGESISSREVRTGEPFTLSFTIPHGGSNVFEIETDPLPQELTLANNRAVISIEGIREKLRVLLVSGEPHAGERTWRNLLKSDANVDLVHFTILRPPEKQDGTPVSELSLIAFPTRELFQTKIKDFDLIIFDRYANQSILPATYYDNIVRYVREGGAVLVAAGPEFASPTSLARTRLSSILPAEPDGRILETPYQAKTTDLGKRHPVTRDLPRPSEWGEWLRQVGAEIEGGTPLLSGANNQPLLVLTREEKGRVAMLLSDHVWLWARGYRGGGPHLELLRSLSHWLMKEPELEEESLRGSASGDSLTILRQTLKDTSPPVIVTSPSGTSQSISLNPDRPGLFKATLPLRELGLYRLTSGDLTAFVSLGPANPKELMDVFSTPDLLRPIAETLNGTSRRVENLSSLPRIQIVRSGTRYSGPDWIGLKPSEGAILKSVSLWPLTLGLAGLVVVLSVLAAWILESRKRLSQSVS